MRTSLKYDPEPGESASTLAMFALMLSRCWLMTEIGAPSGQLAPQARWPLAVRQAGLRPAEEEGILLAMIAKILIKNVKWLS